MIGKETEKAAAAQAEALAVRDKMWSEKVAAAENESARLRLNLASLGAENETLTDENCKLRNEVSVLKRTLERASKVLVSIAKIAPEPIKRAIAGFLSLSQSQSGLNRNRSRGVLRAEQILSIPKQAGLHCKKQRKADQPCDG